MTDETPYRMSGDPPRGGEIRQRATWDQYHPRIVRDLESLVQHELQQSGAATVYVIGSSDLRAECSGLLAGMTSPYVATLLRDAVRQPWEGLAPGMIICDGTIIGGRSDDDETLFADILAIAVHELVHLVEWFPKWSETLSALITGHHLDECRTGLTGSLATDSRDWEHMRDQPRWHAHDWRFVRLAIHAAWRLTQRDQRCPLRSLMPWGQYGYADPWAYLRAIEDELPTLADVPLSMIGEITAPHALLKVWSGDTGVEVIQ